MAVHTMEGVGNLVRLNILLILSASTHGGGPNKENTLIRGAVVILHLTMNYVNPHGGPNKENTLIRGAVVILHLTMNYLNPHGGGPNRLLVYIFQLFIIFHLRRYCSLHPNPFFFKLFIIYHLRRFLGF